MNHRVKVRKDLVEQGVGVPVGDAYICDDVEYKYRWLNDDAEGFEVLHDGEYKTAYTVDFDFINEE